MTEARGAVVCLHASASSSRQWRQLAEDLAADGREIKAIDLYGYGQSPGWPDGRDLYLADEAALVESEAGRDSFDLIGHSYGGAVALTIARTNPARINSLVLIEPVLFAVLLADDPDQPAAREIIAVRDDTSAAVRAGDPSEAGERFVDYWMGEGTWNIMPENRQAATAAAMPKVINEWHAVFGEPAPLSAFAAVTAPTLLVVGSESPASSRGVIHLLHRILPSAQLVEIEGVGHMSPITHPELVDPVLAEFLRHYVRPDAEQANRDGG